jgi:hypothetical protein
MSVLGDKHRPGGTFDSDLEMKDAGLVATSAAATVDSSAKYLDVGTGLFKGCVILDVTALEIADTDETYDIVIQGSNATAFTAASSVELVALHLGAKQIKRTDTDKDDGTGRFKLYFDNENDGTFYRYIRIYTVVGGTITNGINYSAFVVPML